VSETHILICMHVSGPLSLSVGLTVTKPKYLTLVLRYCNTQTVKEYEGRGWGESVGGRFITHNYNNVLFCFAFDDFYLFLFPLYNCNLIETHTK